MKINVKVKDTNGVFLEFIFHAAVFAMYIHGFPNRVIKALVIFYLCYSQVLMTLVVGYAFACFLGYLVNVEFLPFKLRKKYNYKVFIYASYTAFALLLMTFSIFESMPYLVIYYLTFTVEGLIFSLFKFTTTLPNYNRG